MYEALRNIILTCGGEFLASPPNPPAGGPPLLSCRRLLIQYIRSYPPYLQAVSSNRNPKIRHAVLTRYPLNTVYMPTGTCAIDVASMGEMKNLPGEPQGKTLPGRSRRRLEANIKTDFRETG